MMGLLEQPIRSIVTRLSFASPRQRGRTAITRQSQEGRILQDVAEFAVKLPARASNLATMRRFLAHALVLCDSRANEAEAALVLSELVSNALEHGRSSVLTVTLRIATSDLTIEVFDESRSEPRLQESYESANTGRGLRIVDRLADQWGWSYPDEEHKVVWAALRSDSARPDAAKTDDGRANPAMTDSG
jgi:anti-sigma regulatory factor (Ser/Thr protein kinase)